MHLKICRWKCIIARRCQYSPPKNYHFNTKPNTPFTRFSDPVREAQGGPRGCKTVSLTYVSRMKTRFSRGKWRFIIIRTGAASASPPCQRSKLDDILLGSLRIVCSGPNVTGPFVCISNSKTKLIYDFQKKSFWITNCVVTFS